MKITQFSASRLNIQVEDTGLWIGQLIASMIMWSLVIQYVIATKLWQRWGTFDLWAWGSLCILLSAIIATIRLFTYEHIRICTFDLHRQQIEIEMYRFLRNLYTVKIPLGQLQDVQIHKESGDSNDYYYISLKFTPPGKLKLVLPERTEDEKIILERIAKVRNFLSMPPL